MKGGDEQDEPPSTEWLVVVYFYTLWSSESATTRSMVDEILSSNQQNVTFLSVRAES